MSLFKLGTNPHQPNVSPWPRGCIMVRYTVFFSTPFLIHANTREPTPTHSFKRVKLGDVGYLRRGRFHLLFSAGCPLGDRRLGVDVPATFIPLNVGPIVYSQPRPPGCLSPGTIQEVTGGLAVSVDTHPCVRSVSSVLLKTNTCNILGC